MRCSNCSRSFKTLADEAYDHACPHCGYHPWDKENFCKECDAELEVEHDYNYGADADGRRGIHVTFVECPNGCEVPE